MELNSSWWWLIAQGFCELTLILEINSKLKSLSGYEIGWSHNQIL